VKEFNFPIVRKTTLGGNRKKDKVHWQENLQANNVTSCKILNTLIRFWDKQHIFLENQIVVFSKENEIVVSLLTESFLITKGRVKLRLR